ncbi:ubiquitin-conjugating enzyme/RWD-like protein [Tribonema minus]|uniref:Ubiquitin-conjugating enzyme/RWD-like protein n=1 Tax=Tribonema minus TaxID=303371 RepID=A0A836CDZ9_9STRA|nr:ubiquitin-conjugating enzyme/RWD-like protein [Tribonema minus]
MAAKNPAIKRIHADIRELNLEPSPNYHAAPLEDNLFDWHFTLRGPQGTDFQGGIYHGRIQLPAEWPFKPPDITFYTENGRFSVGSKICLSISAHHPEQWQPAWGIRLILEALITFMPTEGGGAIGSLDWPPEERSDCCCPPPPPTPPPHSAPPPPTPLKSPPPPRPPRPPPPAAPLTPSSTP